MMNPADFIPNPYTGHVESGSFTWSAPSNIALVKYWGKRGDQLPANPSISFTLDACKTVTSVQFEKRETGSEISFDFLFEGQPKPEFDAKIETFFSRINPYLPFLKDYHFAIDSKNTFPHSSGIASSASGMAAFAVDLVQIEKLLDPAMSDDFFYRKASFLARLGSGSACRSVKGKAVVWGAHAGIKESSDLYGVEFPGEMHPVFEGFHDTILLVDKGEKKVSSSVGHELMNGHPFAARRFEKANENLSALANVLKNGDLAQFVSIVESEALTLHAMMMTSMPNFILMMPDTLAIINAIREFRRETNIQACFTLDAGANVHLLYPAEDRLDVAAFIDDRLAKFCNGSYIHDRIGTGAKCLI